MWSDGYVSTGTGLSSTFRHRRRPDLCAGCHAEGGLVHVPGTTVGAFRLRESRRLRLLFRHRPLAGSGLSAAGAGKRQVVADEAAGCRGVRRPLRGAGRFRVFRERRARWDRSHQRLQYPRHGERAGARDGLCRVSTNGSRWPPRTATARWSRASITRRLTSTDNWAHRDPRVTDVITMLEVINSNDKIHEAGFVNALDYGWKVAPVAGNDNHGLGGIVRQTSRTFVLATTLTKAAVLDAMQHRRAYASLDKNLQCRYTINGMTMGSTLRRPASFRFDITCQRSRYGRSSGPHHQARHRQGRRRGRAELFTDTRLLGALDADR